MREYRRHDGHDGICWECGEVLYPVPAITHFGYEILDAAPEQRITTARNRVKSEPVSLLWWEVLAELRESGIDPYPVRAPGCLTYSPDILDRAASAAHTLAQWWRRQ